MANPPTPLDESAPKLTPEEIAEHLHFMEKSVERHRETVRKMAEPRALLAIDYEIQQLECSIIAREEFKARMGILND